MALFPCLLVLVIYPRDVLCANVFLYVPFLS